MYGLKQDWTETISHMELEIEDYQGAMPRWCPGCGDHAVLGALQRLCRDEQLPRERVVVVSGIGCSSRFPHYMSTYGFHGLHGRALPIAQGVKSRRPDLHVFVTTGDGDNCSIGAGHWIHAIRYNMNMTVVLFDNAVYGLTKKQSSPTTPRGMATNTHPRGAWIDPINPLETTLGITNVSFVAQTVDWNPVHLSATLAAAHAHKGLSFVRVIQRCPHYTAGMFDHLQQDPSQVVLLTHPDGISAQGVQRAFPNSREHDPSDLSNAREVASTGSPLPVGLLYRNRERPTYDTFTAEGLGMPPADKLAAVRAHLDRYKV